MEVSGYVDENPCNIVDGGDIVRVSIPAGACELDQLQLAGNKDFN